VDAYSFAIVWWELIHNKLPFEGMSNLQAAYAAAFKVSSVVFIISQNSNEILRKHLFQGDLLGWWLY
jgi:hypothetical protein